MNTPIRRIVVAALLALSAVGVVVRAQQSGLTAADKAKRWDVENELQSIAIVERKVMMPMRDGVRLATDIYRPKNATGKVPTIWVRTPYNFNFWDIQNGVPSDMTAALDRREARLRVRRCRTSAAISFPKATTTSSARRAPMATTPSTGCRSSRGPTEKSARRAARRPPSTRWASPRMGHPAYAAMNVQGFGAGVGRVGPYYEQGNWYRGGAVQMLFITWLYGEQNQVRPMFPRDTPREDLVRASKSFDLAQHLPPVDWAKELWHLPEQDILKNVDGPRGIFADQMPVATGGKMIERTPNDPAWYKGGLYHDDMKFNLPGLWFMSWYDVSVGPNLALYNHVRKTASADIANEQWAIIAPVAHCSYTRATADTDRRRAQHGRCAPRLQRDRLRLLRQVPQRARRPRASTRCRR